MRTRPAVQVPDRQPPPGRFRATILLPASGPPTLRLLRLWLGGGLVAYAVGLQLAAAASATAWQWPMHLDAFAPPDPRLLLAAAARGLPIGYFVAFAQRSRRALLHAAVIGFAFALALALLGAVGHGAVDGASAFAGAVGALAGGVVFLLMSARLRARAGNDAALLAPDLPLVGGAYLATPLLWLAAESYVRGGGTGVPWSVLLLGLYGTTLLGSARASRGSAGGGPHVHAAVAAAWFAAGAAPLAGASLGMLSVLAAFVSAFGALHPLLLGARGRERRIEGPALRRALPFLGLYLCLAAAAPLAAMRAGREGIWIGWVVVEAASAPGSWAELLAAFAMLGYSLAELRGRLEERWELVSRALAPTACVSALTVAGLWSAAFEGGRRDMPLRVGAFALGSVALVGAAFLGMALYRVGRAHARSHALVAGVQGAATATADAAAAGRADGARGYIRRSWPPHKAPSSMRAPCTARSNGWRTRSSSSTPEPTG